MRKHNISVIIFLVLFIIGCVAFYGFGDNKFDINSVYGIIFVLSFTWLYWGLRKGEIEGEERRRRDKK